METMVLNDPLIDIKLNSIREIDREVEELTRKINILKDKRVKLIEVPDFIGKYYRVTNSSNKYVSYIHVEDTKEEAYKIKLFGDIYNYLDVEFITTVDRLYNKFII